MPKSTLTDARARRSREALRHALLALIEEKPFEQVTIREIASRAGVSFPTFYRQFATKEALMDDIAAGQIDDLLAIALPLMEEQDSKVSSQAICAFVQERRVLWRALLTTGATAALRDVFISRAREIGHNSQRRNPGLPVDLMAPFAVGGIFEILSWWLRQTEEVPADYVAQVLDALVVKPSVRRLDVRLPSANYGGSESS